MPPAARPGPAKSSTTAPRLDRSLAAFESAARPVRSSCAGRLTSACSAARRTSTSPEAKRDIGPICDQGGDPAVGEEMRDACPIVHGPDPRREAMALAVAQNGESRQLLVNSHEISVAALQPSARKELAQTHAKLLPRRKTCDLLAD